MDTSHLVALQTRLSHERGYLANARTDNERALRTVWIGQIQREIDSEMKRLGFALTLPDISDDDLLAALSE